MTQRRKFYVSLVKDLINVYLEFEAEDEAVVRKYLHKTYYRHGVYTLPWCGVYSEQEFGHTNIQTGNPNIIKPHFNRLYTEDWEDYKFAE